MVKKPPVSAGDARDTDSISGLRRYPGGRNGNPLQDSCLENPMDRGLPMVGYSSWGCKELDMTEHEKFQVCKSITLIKEKYFCLETTAFCTQTVTLLI